MSHSDAIVFFGAIGDLAYKQIFPALQALVKRHTLDIPIIGVAKAGWTLDQLRVRACQSVTQHCGVDEGRIRQVVSLTATKNHSLEDPLRAASRAGT